MADGKIKILVDVDGKQAEITSDQLDKMGKSAQEVGKETGGAESSVKKFAKSLGLIAIGAAAFNVLRKSLDGAIKRFDTLNAFPKVLQALGVSAEDSQRAMDNLADGIDGLPTKLNDIAQSAQRMYTSFNDIDKATDTALALNNALLGSGSSAEQAERGTEQYIKALQIGKIQMDTWNTLSETMDVALVKIAEGFGYAGASAKDDLYQALQDGTVTIDQFNDKLIEIGTGTGIMADLARENTLGIATSFENLRTAAVIGLANIIDALNDLSKNVTGSDIAQNIDRMKVVVRRAFAVIVRAIETSTPYVIAFADGVKAAIPVVKTLSPAIIGLMAAYGSYVVITKAQAAFAAMNGVIAIATASTKGLTLMTTAQMTAQAASTSATTADTVAKAAQGGAVNLLTLAFGVLTGSISLSTAAQTIATPVTYAFGAAIRFLMGPIGWVVTGIGLLTAGTIALVKWFKRSGSESEKLTSKTEELGDATDDLAENVRSNNKAYEDQEAKTYATKKANESLIRNIEQLSGKEEKSAVEKQKLKSYVDELNDSVDGLNVAYDENNDALSTSLDEMQAHVDLMKEKTSYTDALERQLEIEKEQAETVELLRENNEAQEEANRLIEDSTFNVAGHRAALMELEEQEEELKETNIALVEQWETANEVMTGSMSEMIELVESGRISQAEMVDAWIEKNEELVASMQESYQEIYEITTDAFEKINDESSASAEEMIENLKHNQEMMKEWGENISELMGYATENGHEGFLHWLETLGPDSAAEIAVINDMSDAELKEFANLMEKGADVSTDAFTKSLGEGMEEGAELLKDEITALPETMQSAARDASFDTVGQDIVDGYIEGILDNVDKGADAGRDLAEATEEGTRKASKTNSPSRVFMDIGEDLTDGLKLGIEGGTQVVLNAAQRLAIDTINQFNGFDMEFQSIGLYAMAGLERGLNAGSGIVMATARRIANQVAATMKASLQIHSPSRLFRDEIGKMLPEGMAIGIEDNAMSVFKALDSLTGKITNYASPEMALAAFPDAGFRGNATTNNINNYASSKQYDDSLVVKLLNSIANKETSIYIDGEKVTDVVNENNAINAGINYF